MLKRISLQNFRNYQKREFELDQINVVIGDNGVGKSNLIEAIYLLATGKSFRADSDAEMIRYDTLCAIVSGTVDDLELKIILNDRKKYEVNNIPRRQVDFVGRLRAVLFGPNDMELLTGSPGARRRYLDFVISQADREYRRCLISYEKGLRQRNKLLDLIRDGLATRSQLFFWDRLLIKDGEYLTLKRGEFLEKFGAVYDKSVISEVRIKQYEVEEVAAGTTLVGPHRDNFYIEYEGRDVAKYGSRGQQRMMLLKLKLWERDYLSTEALPMLLLDDVFSELDHTHRDEVIKIVKEHTERGGQVVMTSADEHMIPEIHEAGMVKL